MSQTPQYQSRAGGGQPGDEMATLIPYRNVPALVGYYLGVFAIIPCIGPALGIAAVILGIKGLKVASENPQAKGKAHAIVAIVCGSLFGLVHLVIDVLIVIGIVANAGR